MIKNTPSHDVAVKLMDRLGTDPAFREKMLGDPKSAMAEYGIDVDESKIPTVRVLPPMEDLQRNRDAYAARMNDDLGFMVFFLR